MQANELINTLSTREKIFLAARLTQAVMSSLETDYEPDEKLSYKDIAKASADRTYMVFGRLLERICSGYEPECFPDKKEKEDIEDSEDKKNDKKDKDDRKEKENTRRSKKEEDD